MLKDSREFAIGLIQRAHAWAEQYVAEEYGRIQGPLTREGLIQWCRTLMWREYMLGCHVPAKTMSLLPDSAQDLKLLLTTQILDEWKHYQIFSERARQLGGDGDLNRFEPTEADWQLYHETYDWGEAIELATALNCCGEVMLSIKMKMMVDPGNLSVLDEETAGLVREQVLPDEQRDLRRLVDPETARLIEEDVLPDEGRHIRIGRLILERFATTEEAQQRVLRVFERKTQAFQYSHNRLVSDMLARA